MAAKPQRSQLAHPHSADLDRPARVAVWRLLHGKLLWEPSTGTFTEARQRHTFAARSLQGSAGHPQPRHAQLSSRPGPFGSGLQRKVISELSLRRAARRRCRNVGASSCSCAGCASAESAGCGGRLTRTEARRGESDASREHERRRASQTRWACGLRMTKLRLEPLSPRRFRSETQGSLYHCARLCTLLAR